MLKKVSKYLFTMLLMALMAGCASSSLFSPYPSQMQSVMVKFKGGAPERAYAALDKKTKSADASLYLLEKARLAQIDGNYALSKETFESAIALQRQVEEQALISATRLAAGSVALVSNDNALPYRLAPYERILMHHMQATNYLALGEVESALVEVRLAEQVQREAAEKNADVLEQARSEARQRQVDLDSGMTQLQARYSSLMADTDSILSPWQNAYTHYTSAFIYEIAGQKDDAYIDYKRAFELVPSNTYVLNDVIRLAQEIGRQEDYDNYLALKKLPPDVKEESLPVGRQLLVVFEQGQVNAKQETRMDINTPKGWFSVALPIYYSYDVPVKLEVYGEGELLGRAALLMDANQLAVRELKNKMPLILARQLGRVMAKQGLRKKADENFGPGAAFISTVWGVISEQADRRSWLSLPANAQVLRLNLAEGLSTLSLQVAGTSLRESLILDESAPLQMVRVIELGHKLYVQSLFPAGLNVEEQ